jgi:hypothetical protein
VNDAPWWRTDSTARVDARTLTLIALLALAASGPSLFNGFAYDDYWIVVTNGRVHTLARWHDWLTTSYWPTREASLYRPLTTAAFAVQWVIGHGTPFIFHFVNVVLYVAGAVAFAWLASMFLPAAPALIVAALFAVHPAHVEATGNVVGQSELSAGLVLLLAAGIYIRARRAGPLSRRTVATLGALYFAGSELKEHAMMLPAILVAAELTVLRDLGEWKTRVRALLPAHAMFAVIGVAVIAVRFRVIGALGGDIPHPALDGLGFRGRGLVMLGVLPDLARLLVWPARLYADYSPDQILVFSEPNSTQINGALVAIGALVLFAVAWRRSAVAAFGLMLAFGAWLPTANLLFPSGILLSERTLYIPTAGMLLALGVCIAWFGGRMQTSAALRTVAGALLGVVLILGIARSVDRQRAWSSRDEAFWIMHRDEPLSFRAHHAWGSILFERSDLRGGEREWRMAMRIFPNYHMVYQDLAHVYREHHLCPAAIPLYERAIQLSGGLVLNVEGLVACQLELARFRDARAWSLKGIAYGEEIAWFRARIKSADSALAANDSTR